MSVVIKQVKSSNGANGKQRDTLRTLGLRGIGKTVERDDSPQLRGPNKKMSMPFEPFRTHTQPVNLADLEARFEDGASVDLEALHAAGLATRKGIPVKILARGELTKPLTVHAHAFSKAAREKIEAAGGTVQVVES